MKKRAIIAILNAFWHSLKESKFQDIKNNEIMNCYEKFKNVKDYKIRLSKLTSLYLLLLMEE